MDLKDLVDSLDKEADQDRLASRESEEPMDLQDDKDLMDHEVL